MRHLMNTTCTISYNVEGSRNDLGEPARTLTERDADVICRIEARSRSLSYEFPQRIRLTEEQGLVEQTTHIMFVGAGQTVEAHDVITDADSKTYTVATVVSQGSQGNSHKEVLMTKTTGI